MKGHAYYLVDRRQRDLNLGWKQNHAVLVVAQNPEEARQLAAEDSGEEGPGPWQDPGRSKVIRIGAAVAPSLIVMRQHAI